MLHEKKSYLTFMLGDEKFALDVTHIREVVELSKVTRIPYAPDFLSGIINLRGRILPLLNTRMKIGLPEGVPGSKSRVVVLNIHEDGKKSFEIGALVDSAREVVEIGSDAIQPLSEYQHAGSNAITGIVNDNGNVTLMMDIEKVFSLKELTEVNQSIQ